MSQEWKEEKALREKTLRQLNSCDCREDDCDKCEMARRLRKLDERHHVIEVGVGGYFNEAGYWISKGKVKVCACGNGLPCPDSVILGGGGE